MKLDDLIKEFRATTTEPLWRIVLNWGSVIIFFAFPFILMTIQLYLLSHPQVIPDPTKYQQNFKHLAEFQRNLTILVFGLAGLKTWEQIKNGRKNNSPSEQTQQPTK